MGQGSPRPCWVHRCSRRPHRSRDLLCSWLRFVTVKRHKAKSAEGRGAQGQVQGKPGASLHLVPGEQPRTHWIPPAVICNDMSSAVYQESSLKSWNPVFLSRVSHIGSCCLCVWTWFLKLQTPRGRAGIHCKSHELHYPGNLGSMVQDPKGKKHSYRWNIPRA